MGYRWIKMPNGLINIGKWSCLFPTNFDNEDYRDLREKLFSTTKFMPIDFKEMQAYYKSIFYWTDSKIRNMKIFINPINWIKLIWFSIKKTIQTTYRNIKNKYFITKYTNGDFSITKAIYDDNYKVYSRRALPGVSVYNKLGLGVTYDSDMIQLQKTYQKEGATIVKRNLVVFKHITTTFMLERTYNINTRKLIMFRRYSLFIHQNQPNSDDMKIDAQLGRDGCRKEATVYAHDYKQKYGGRDLSEKRLKEVLKLNPTTCPLKMDNVDIGEYDSSIEDVNKGITMDY